MEKIKYTKLFKIISLKFGRRGTICPRPISNGMNKKLVIGIIVIAILIAGGYFVFFKKAVAPITNEQQNSLATETSTIDTSDWKTYKNDKYGFEFRYPSDFAVEQNDGDGSTPDVGWVRVYCTDRGSECGSQEMGIFIYDKSNELIPQTNSRVTKTFESGSLKYAITTKEVYQETSKSAIIDRGPSIDANLANQILSTFRFAK